MNPKNIPTDGVHKLICGYSTRETGWMVVEPIFSITDVETAFKAVALNGTALQFVLHDLRTEALALVAIEQNAHALKYVPIQYRTEAVLLKALESDIYVLPHIPEQAWSEAIAVKVVARHALDLEHVPLKFLTELVVLKAVQGNGMALEHVPKQFLTQLLVDVAVAGCNKALQYAPREFRTEEALLRAGLMYKFNYQFLVPGDDPFFTCIVPTEWLSKNLPTMGGDVAYVSPQSQQEIRTDYIFEVSEGDAASQSRTIILEIHHKEWTAETGQAATHTRLLAEPVTIHCRAIGDSEVNNDWCVEVLLLNHFFGSCALSASMGNHYLDYADVYTVMQMSPEFDFEFGIGAMPADILPGILERVMPTGYKSAFLMLSGKSGKVGLAHLDELAQAFDSDEASLLFSDVAVDQDKMLISVLLGR